MRQTQIFAGSSHPTLVEGICDRLGQKPGKVELRKFSNGETSVQIQTSVRDQDVFIVQSGSDKINDNVIELLIMISACNGGSSKSITAVMPYFPYSRQSKKKSHRGSITARMLANLLHVAGVKHVITIDLHASQMQGFFKCPVDNLIAEPLLARWIRLNVPNWREAVVVSKNPGGTKRVTSLADALKLSFGIVTTDRRRTRYNGTMSTAGSVMFESTGLDGVYEPDEAAEDNDPEVPAAPLDPVPEQPEEAEDDKAEGKPGQNVRSKRDRAFSNPLSRRVTTGTNIPLEPSPLVKSTRAESMSSTSPPPLRRASTVADSQDLAEHDEYTDERARDVIHGRLVQGHIVDDNFPSPAISATSTTRNRAASEEDGQDTQLPETMISSFLSTASSHLGNDHALGGTGDAGATSEEEEDDLRNPEVETTITLVGNVKNRPVFIVDDMIDKAGSWIAAAETVVKRGGATKVYCMATHGLFGGDCLQEMEECECIDKIIVTNSFPISPEKMAMTGKLVVLGVENLLAEAIRRNHHGEPISQLFMHYD